MRTMLSGLMAAAIAATAAIAIPSGAQAERLVYYGDDGPVYRVDSDRSWRWHRHHRPRVYSRYYDDPYYDPGYRTYHAFGPVYDRPYYPQRYWGWRHHRRPGVSIEFGF